MSTDEASDNPVAQTLASVIAHADEAKDPRIDRLAMIAGDLLDRITGQRQNASHPVARSMGWRGAVGKIERATGIAADVLARAQKTLDSEEPDPAAIAAGIGAARRLIGAASTTSNDDALQFMANALLGRFVDEDGVQHDHSMAPAYAPADAWPCCPRGSRSAEFYTPDWAKRRPGLIERVRGIVGGPDDDGSAE